MSPLSANLMSISWVVIHPFVVEYFAEYVTYSTHSHGSPYSTHSTNNCASPLTFTVTFKTEVEHIQVTALVKRLKKV